MKELRLFEIRDKALESGRSVYSTQQLASLIKKPKAQTTVYVKRLIDKKMAVKVRKGTIAFENDEAIIASQLIEPSYISLQTALLFQGIIQQVTKDIECVTTRNSFNLKKLGIKYHKIPSKLFNNYKKIQKGKSYIMLAEPEKALFDGLYLNIFNKKDLMELKQKINQKKLKELIEIQGSNKLKKMIKND